MGEPVNPPTERPAALMAPSALIGLLAGVAVLLATLLIAPPAGLTTQGWHTLGLALLMAIWWSTEPIPIGITAILPLILLPLIGEGEINAAASPYANPLVFLFLGGFLLSAGVKRWGLHRRLAYSVVHAIGTEPRRLVLGFMVATGTISMWISNTAAIVLMLPVATSVISALAEGHGADDENVHRFSRALLLGLAYGASIGGIGTLIGTPPNALLAGYLSESHGIDLSFAAWAAVGIPLVIVFLPIGWLVLTRLAFPVSAEFSASMKADAVVSRLASGTPASPAEWRIAIVFLTAAVLWITRPLLNAIPGLQNLSDPGIALACALALFLIPNGLAGRNQFLLRWQDAQQIPWSVLLLFGGGLSLASAMDRSGLAQWIGAALAGLDGLSPFAFLLILTLTVVLLTELASNTATVAALLPIVATMAAATGIDLVVLASAVALAASCAFMLPVATPPNAIVFSTGELRVADMMKAGVYMNIISVILVAAGALTLGPVLSVLR
ncbi:MULTISPECIES: SLC13 family permease [Alphaproteobacteria]|uniref:Di-and tricarboxylate transporter n=2 Tax=Alphaproteobacteria TaxID=28211 RepID=A0A512HD08_9HYPH|nr:MULTISPECIES: DASS family sodium-coupled anion symporter [Alphaproteobacteria]GEO83250.1 di- and tricarboxylate transporter [Ciceribacter naphthalenivorans]GLR20355.1 di- and tricarboxylate transporter [Ciceribacter naphthalenivorans]GLT03211.1 di- and tricarboxylate transporter [Sphingomonas psychrolutea]